MASSIAVSLTIIAALLGAPPNRPDPLTQGMRLYDALKFKAAMPHLDRAKADTGRSVAERARAAIYLAIIHLSLGDDASADRNIDEALRLDRAVKPPIGASPKVSQLLEKRRLLLPPAEVPPPQPIAAAAPPAATATEQAPAPVYDRWWFWTAVGTLVVAGAATSVYLATGKNRDDDAKSGSNCGSATSGCLTVTISQ